MKVIGLTGSMGCGKSTVAAMLRQRGVPTIDADAVARDVRGEDAVAGRIRRRFGTTDPAALARLVFGDPAALADLEAMVHPGVRDAVVARLAAFDAEGEPVAAVEAIKLFESPLREQCDQVWVVDCRPEDQRSRLRGRGLSEAELGDRIARQRSAAAFRAAADLVIDGSADPTETARQVEAALAALRG